MNYIPIILFLIVASINISNNKSDQTTLNHRLTIISKPFLMPLLLTHYLLNAKIISGFIVAALIFGWLGDLIIIFHHEVNQGKTSKNMKPLLMGLLFFLCGHIAYISIFMKDIKSITPIVLMSFVIYLLGGTLVYLYLLNNGLLKKDTPKVSSNMRNVLKWAVGLYMLVIIAMSYTGFVRWTSLNSFSSFLTLLGTLLFLVSDTSLSLKEFGEQSFIPEMLVMITYTLAQCFIITGLL